MTGLSIAVGQGLQGLDESSRFDGWRLEAHGYRTLLDDLTLVQVNDGVFLFDLPVVEQSISCLPQWTKCLRGLPAVLLDGLLLIWCELCGT